MEDGSKSTDEANAHRFKVKKEKKTEDGESSEDEKHPAPKRATSAWGFFQVQECKRLREIDGEL
jgi:hypothetical protein